jgi:type IV fimbrial biogenesis protein FimT
MSMRAAYGYSLVELLSVISIGAILMTLGVPSYRYVSNSNRVTTEVNSLYLDLEMARSTALEAGSPVTVCPSTDGHTCSSGSQAWQGGWIIFTDLNGNASVDPGDTVLVTRPAFTTRTDTFLSGQDVYAVSFNREGFATNLPSTSAGFITITLHTQPQATAWTRCIQVSTVGMLTTERAQQGSCT